jgi:DNA adenine methylase
MEFPKPPLKWVGGKSQQLPTLIGKFPRTIHNYHEPFLGGGSVLLATLTAAAAGTIRITGSIYASDLNRHLINFYTQLQQNTTLLIAAIERLAAAYVAAPNQEEFYYNLREQFNTAPTAEPADLLKAATRFLVLNKTCFRGLYREGPRGFNVPFGNYPAPAIPTREELRETARLIAPVIFRCQPYATSLTATAVGDFVYLDPPYVPIRDTSFVGYNKTGFSEEEHCNLFRATKALPCNFLMSNAAAPLIDEQFPQPAYTIERIECRRAINAKNPGETATEVMISPSQLP